MNKPGPSNSKRAESASSPFGFPEKEVVFFINSCHLNEEEARNFMLFLSKF
ncbi:hypothetical protein GCK32_021094 [Trichostrongylus colubriformis]|uniref:Uncharacterized protein n=1 Tax=Trichostrongylus colubriformis TaxID=6319 RepID=A0AAN8FRK5_TRICO